MLDIFRQRAGAGDINLIAGLLCRKPSRRGDPPADSMFGFQRQIHNSNMTGGISGGRYQYSLPVIQCAAGYICITCANKFVCI